MQNKITHVLISGCALLTFVIPLVQLLIGFHYVVKDGQSASEQCAAAPDLPLLMAIGGIFTLFFLGTAYGLLKMLSSIHIEQSDIAGRMPRILVGLVGFIFGSITFIFFALIQIRIYQAYSTNIPDDIRSNLNICQPTVIHGALVLIILTYISCFLFIGIYVTVLVDVYYIRRQEHYKEFETKTTVEETKF